MMLVSLSPTIHTRRIHCAVKENVMKEGKLQRCLWAGIELSTKQSKATFYILLSASRVEGRRYEYNI
jgi:hypothetical protein